MKTKILIVGGGFAGLSTAYHLARAGVKRLVVLEQAPRIGEHASGRNAGMIRQAIADPVLARLAEEGAGLIRKLPKEGWKNLGLRASGSLLLATRQTHPEMVQIKKSLKQQRIGFQLLSKLEAYKKSKALHDACFGAALFCPSDFVLDIDALLKGFLERLKAWGVPVLLGESVKKIDRRGGIFQVQTSKHQMQAEKIVNAAGAWASVLSESAGASRIPLLGYRRHLFFSGSLKFNVRSWPFIWDLSKGLYFRPQRGHLLLSPCDKVPFDLKDRTKCRQAWSVDASMQQKFFKKLKRFSSAFSSLKIDRATAGLRTMSPDGRFVVGEDPKSPGFFWVAGLGGHGVTCAFSVGKLAARQILGKPTDPKIQHALSPARFT